MIYEIRFDKNPTIQVVNGKKKLIWVPRYTAEHLAVLAANAEAGLGDKFVTFGTADEPTAQKVSIEYVDQPTPEATTAVNEQIDAIIATWASSIGA
jgi:hypothetical protein